jgi:two-component system, OmpR family, sensor kinase
VRTWTLRRRLVVAIIALLAAISLVIGAVAIVALRGYLVERLDRQITEATSRAQSVIDRPIPAPGGVPDSQPRLFLPLAGLQPGAIGAYITDDAIEGAILTDRVSGNTLGTTTLTDAEADALRSVPDDGTAVTVDLGRLGEYRVAATATKSGATALVGLPLAEVDATVLQLLVVIAVVAASGLLIAALAGTAIVRLALRPLDRVVATASHVAELPLERGEVALGVRVPDADADPSTEVGRVGAAINRMLGHVASALSAREASEKKVRTFVADASHELRTPLASIRGYSELTRRGGHELPADVVHALGRIESESLRMTSLVEDLLLLARLDDGRSLEELPVDLRRLLADAVSDAQAAGQQHEWVLDLPAEPVELRGDSARLHQVVANLLANARTHTPPGTVVTVGARLDGATAEIRVADTGPGIDPTVLSTVFERFARGDSSRSRSAGSTGLGLAIVEAVVTAHRGTVTVQSEPGSTVFTVRLPISE